MKEGDLSTSWLTDLGDLIDLGWQSAWRLASLADQTTAAIADQVAEVLGGRFAKGSDVSAIAAAALLDPRSSHVSPRFYRAAVWGNDVIGTRFQSQLPRQHTLPVPSISPLRGRSQSWKKIRPAKPNGNRI
jgi:hypothetical protein